ncbi:MAG: GNAT family N-acetyltransferase [Commensalibacter sp.]|nr:GNAT family N-acetyltransferase [Commensalibacter sp.]
MYQISSSLLPQIQIDQVTEFQNEDDLHALCEALDAYILGGGYYKWIKNPPPRHLMENYLRGVLLVPEKILFIARLDGNIVGSCELKLPRKEKNSPHIGAFIDLFGIAPYARNVGVEALMLTKAEQTITQAGYPIVNIVIDETQQFNFDFYLQKGYIHWATHPYYRRIEGQIVKGLFLYKSFLNS